MATKLKNLKIKKVDFVDQGANPDAHIRMVKRKDGEAQQGNDTGGRTGGVWKRLVSAIAKATGIDQEDLESAVEDIEKSGAMTFGEQMNERKRRKIIDEMWDICFALENSLVSIMCDEELDSSTAQTAMQESLDEFNEVVKDAITQWSNGKAASIVMKSGEVSEPDLEIMKSAVKRLNETIEEAEKKPSGKTKKDQKKEEKPKGDNEEMKIDKSKLTDAERAFLESIEKRYGTEDGDGFSQTGVVKADTKGKGTEEEEEEEEKGAKKPPVKKSVSSDDPDNIYKGLHPAVAAEMKELRKFRQESEEKELKQIAKKYEVIGKKEEELVPLLKSLKAAGGTAYNDMIAILDQTVETVEKSGVFSEIGKSGHGASGGNSVEVKISGIAKGYMEKDPSLSYNAAVAKAWEDNPELLSEYDDEAGF